MTGENEQAYPGPTGDCLRADGKVKRTYLTKHDAKRAVKSAPRGYLIEGALHIYLCPDCNYYHIGHID